MFNFVKKLSQPALKRVAVAVITSMAGVAAHGHGVWFGNGTITYDAATTALLNSNLAAGTPGFQNGNVVTILTSFPVLGAGTLSSPGGYITYYVPTGYEVVGAAVTDSAGNPISARNGTSPSSGEGISKGWGPRGQSTFNVTASGWNPFPLSSACTTFGKTAATCNNGLAYTYGDTGIFYSTRSDTAYFPAGQDIAVTNGYGINPTNAAPWGDVGGGTNPARVHNKWDAVQSNAFGSTAPLLNAGFTIAESTSISDGRGPTPYLAGSPVAGFDAGSPLDRYGTTGPWQRISYPGSCTTINSAPATSAGGTGADPATGVNSVSVCSPTSAGASLSTSSPLPSGTNALRIAIGGIDIGTTRYAKVSFRVVNSANLGTVNCEASGGDSTQGAANGNDNVWRYYVGAVCLAPAAPPASLNLTKAIVRLNGQPYDGTKPIMPGAVVRYRISYANTWTRTQTNVALSDVLPAGVTNATNFAVVSGANVLPTSPAAPIAGGTTFTFTTIPSLASGAGGVVEFDATVVGAIGSTVTNTARAVSTQVTALVTAPTTFTVASNIVNITIAKTDGKATTSSGDTNNYVITLSNAGPAAADGAVLTDVVGAGLTCPGASVLTCAVTAGGAVCPAAPLTVAGLTGTGYAVPTFPANSALQFTYACTVN